MSKIYFDPKYDQAVQEYGEQANYLTQGRLHFTLESSSSSTQQNLFIENHYKTHVQNKLSFYIPIYGSFYHKYLEIKQASQDLNTVVQLANQYNLGKKKTDIVSLITQNIVKEKQPSQWVQPIFESLLQIGGVYIGGRSLVKYSTKYFRQQARGAFLRNVVKKEAAETEMTPLFKGSAQGVRRKLGGAAATKRTGEGFLLADEEEHTPLLPPLPLPHH